MTALAECEHRLSGERVDAMRLQQLNSQRDVPGGTGARLLDVELPAHQLEACAASGGGELEHVAEGHGRAIDSLSNALSIHVSGYARGGAQG